MLEAIELGDAEWPYGEEWETRMRRWAKRCGRLIVLSDNQVHRAEGLLGIDAERCVQVSNGFDPEVFQPLPVDRAAHWRRHLVDEPQGWRPGEEAGQRRLRGRRTCRPSPAARRCSTWGASPPSSGSGC